MTASTEDPKIGHSAAPGIGIATMRDDRTIILDLARDADGHPVHALLEYRPGSPHYAAVLDHLGGLDPGETKPVQPWP